MAGEIERLAEHGDVDAFTIDTNPIHKPAGFFNLPATVAAARLAHRPTSGLNARHRITESNTTLITQFQIVRTRTNLFTGPPRGSE